MVFEGDDRHAVVELAAHQVSVKGDGEAGVHDRDGDALRPQKFGGLQCDRSFAADSPERNWGAAGFECFGFAPFEGMVLGLSLINISEPTRPS